VTSVASGCSRMTAKSASRSSTLKWLGSYILRLPGHSPG
jgi:hypothetical protein